MLVITSNIMSFILFARKAVVILGRCLLFYISTIPLFALAATFQEHKVWKQTSRGLNPWGLFKVFVLNLFWMILTGLGSLVSLSLGGQSVANNMQNMVVENLTAKILFTVIVGKVKIINPNNTPNIDVHNPTIPAPIFVANHCSQIDLCVVYFILKRFKWIAKQSVKFLPGVGFGMMIGGHIFIQRKGKNGNSVSNLYEQSNEAVQSGVPMMIFPQGTRRIAEKLRFKDGAFKIAIDNQAPIVPISIDIPVNIWNSSYPLNLLWSKESEKLENMVCK